MDLRREDANSNTRRARLARQMHKAGHDEDVLDRDGDSGKWVEAVTAQPQQVVVTGSVKTWCCQVQKFLSSSFVPADIGGHGQECEGN